MANADECTGLLLRELTGEVASSSIIEVLRVDFEGHVYNLQTTEGWYAANGIIVHNCLHTYSAYQEGVTVAYPDKTASELTEEAQAYKDNQTLRGIERSIREAKRLEAVALDPGAQRTAAARVAKYQAAAREHVTATDAVRQYAREQVGKAH